MPRPDPKKVAANKVENAKIKARMDAAAERVQRLITDTISEFRTRLPEEHPDPAMQILFEKLWRAFELAISTSQPGHAVTAVMSEAKLRGYLVDQSLVVSRSIGSQSDLQGNPVEETRNMLTRMRDRAIENGDSAVEECEALIDFMRSRQGPRGLIAQAEATEDAPVEPLSEIELREQLKQRRLLG